MLVSRCVHQSLRQWNPRSGECTVHIQVSDTARRIDSQTRNSSALTGLSVSQWAVDMLGDQLVWLERYHRLRRHDRQALQFGYRQGMRWFAQRACARCCSPLVQVLGTLNAHTASVECVGFCEGAAYAATASLDGRVIVWDIQVC